MGRPRNSAVISRYRFKKVMSQAQDYLVSEGDVPSPIDVSTPPKLARHCGEYFDRHSKDEGGQELVTFTERTIRRNLEDGRMDPRTLDTVARAINVDPVLLSGGTDRLFEMLTDPKDRDDWEELYAHPKYHPYVIREDLGIDYEDCLMKVLRAHGVSKSDFRALGWSESRRLMEDLDWAVTSVLQWRDGDTRRFPNAMPNILLREIDAEEEYETLDERDALEFLDGYREKGGFGMPADAEVTRTPFVPKSVNT